jgi:hypothetical protein
MMFQRLLPSSSWNRLVVSGILCGGLLMATTNDGNGWWTGDLTKEYLTPQTKDIGDWLPESGGIIYSDMMLVFYDTFYANPRAPWRYALGFEATFMTEDNLETYRKIQWNRATPEAFKPWVEKMKPADRMILLRSKAAKPEIEGLEWRYAASGTWIGRLPRATAAGATPGN